MYSFNLTQIKNGYNIIPYVDDCTITWEQAAGLLENDVNFVDFIIDILRKSPYNAYFWETPAATSNQTFNFVIIESKHLHAKANPSAFQDHIENIYKTNKVVVFQSLSKDAYLIVPGENAPTDIYAHIASFIRGAPEEQIRHLFKTIGSNIRHFISSNNKIWLSTSGLAVPWVHVRMDTKPKYYHYTPYTK